VTLVFPAKGPYRHDGWGWGINPRASSVARVVVVVVVVVALVVAVAVAVAIVSRKGDKPTGLIEWKAKSSLKLGHRRHMWDKVLVWRGKRGASQSQTNTVVTG
jgi:hypothetical protein